jgi:hypothetical protein
MIQIIVDSVYSAEEPLVHRSPLMNLVSASGQAGYARAYALELGLEDLPWLLVSPVYFHTTHNDVLMISDCADMDLSAYYETFSKFVMADGWKVHQVLPNLWLIAPTLPLFSSAPLFSIAHRSAKPFLDAWPKEWLTWFTEIQMLFYPLTGDCNAVWVWGAGDYQPVQCQSYHLGMPMLAPYLYMNASDAKKFTGPAHFWWQDTDYVQSAPSLLQRLIKWWKHGN